MALSNERVVSDVDSVSTNVASQVKTAFAKTGLGMLGNL